MWVKDANNNLNIITDTANSGQIVRHAYLIKKPDPNGTFNFRIPLTHILGFAQDYKKVIFRMKQTLTLTRKNAETNDGIFRLGIVNRGKVALDRVTWYMPHIRLSLDAETTLQEIIKSKADIEIAYRARWADSIADPQSTRFTWRLGARSATQMSRYVIVGFQTGTDNNQEKNTTTFDHLQTSNAYVILNDIRP